MVTDRQTDGHTTKYRNPHCAHARRGLMKALKCKPSASALEERVCTCGCVNIARARGFEKTRANECVMESIWKTDGKRKLLRATYLLAARCLSIPASR